MATRKLHVCPDCSSDLVYPVHGEEAGDHSWHVWLRCPECEWRHDAVYGDVDIDAFDRELDRGTAFLAEALAQVELADFADFGKRMIAALEQDLIGADDFAVPRTTAHA